MTKTRINRDLEALPNATVAYMTAVNKLWAYGQRVCDGVPGEPGLDDLLHEVAETGRKLAFLWADEDAGIHRSIWVRLGQGDFE
jgi:hypothetical protein